MDLVAHLHRQRKFSKATFGPGMRTLGVIEHIRKELKEIKANPTDLFEWIDVIALGFDGAWRAGHSPEKVAAALEEKQTICEAREWPDWKVANPDLAIEHIRIAPRAQFRTRKHSK